MVTRPSHPVKSTLFLALLLVLLAAGSAALCAGHRVPVGRVGISVLSDPSGQSFVLIDHPPSQGVLVGYDADQGRVATWTGPVVVHD